MLWLVIFNVKNETKDTPLCSGDFQCIEKGAKGTCLCLIWKRILSKL